MGKRVAMHVAALLGEGKDSSDSEPAMSEVSDQYSMLEHSYQSVRNVFSTTLEGKLVGGDGSLNLESLPLFFLCMPLFFGEFPKFLPSTSCEKL